MPRFHTLFVASLAVLASPALAQDVTYYTGVAVTSNYISNGSTQTQDGPAVQPYFEVGIGGFYTGLWASNVDFGTGDRAEIDLYLGYRAALWRDRLGLDVGYARYFYDDSGDCCGEIKLSALLKVAPGLGVNAYAAYDPVANTLNRRATLAYEVTDALAVSASYGRAGSLHTEYWNVGGSYALNDIASLDLRYHGSGSAAGNPGMVATLTFATSQKTLRRLFGTPASQR